MPASNEGQAEERQTFPMSLQEYQFTTGADLYLCAGLAISAGPGDRYREEWDTLLAEFAARPTP